MNRSTSSHRAAPFLLLIALLALLVPGFASATEQTGTIEGVVKDDEGNALSGANITQKQVNSARGDPTTILPDGLTRPASWTTDPTTNS